MSSVARAMLWNSRLDVEKCPPNSYKKTARYREKCMKKTRDFVLFVAVLVACWVFERPLQESCQLLEK